MYTFTINSNNSGGEQEFHFVVSRDRNKEFHIFKQTSVQPQSGHKGDHSELSGDRDTCINRVAFIPLVALLPRQLHRPLSSSAQAIKVASYNIWNLNSLRDRGEKYQDRLKRLGKVNTFSQNEIVVASHHCLFLFSIVDRFSASGCVWIPGGSLRSG